MQTSRDLIDCLLGKREGPAERMGLYESIWGQTVRKWAEEEGYPRREWTEAEVEARPDRADLPGPPVPPEEQFGYDMVGVGGWFDALPIRGFSEVEEETDEWKIVRNGAGAALKQWKEKAGTPEHIDFRMTSREVWDRDYRPHLLALDPERVNADGAKKALVRQRRAGKWTFYGSLFVFENMRRSMGDLCMYESFLLDPDWIHDYCRVYTDFWKAHYDYLFEHAGVPDGIWLYEDLGYKNGLFISPTVLAQVVFPYYAELVEYFHNRNLPVVLHSCGGVTEAVPMIIEAGFDALNPMEVNAGCDVVDFAEKWGDDLAFVGGFNKVILETGDLDLIEREVTDLVARLKSVGARYVFASDHSISTNTTCAAYSHAVKIFRDNWAY